MKNDMLEIIVRVLKGEATPSDTQELIEWFARDEANMEVFKQYESVWNSLEILRKSPEYSWEEAFLKFKEQVNFREKRYRRSRFYKKLDVLIRIAAVFVIMFGVCYFFFRPKDKNVLPDNSISEITSPAGSKTQILLPDGTKVWLNSESKIHYSNFYNQGERVVFLEGEGYFEVMKNGTRPFIVTTSDIRIKALGTIFNVKSYPGEKTIETTLIEGKLELESGTSGRTTKLITLKPNQKATYYKENKSIKEQQESITKTNDNINLKVKLPENKLISNENVDPSVITSWKNNILYFDDEEFQDLAVKLERRFGVKIHFIDENLKKVHFRGKFPDYVIEQILAALQFASPFYYQFNDDDIYLSENPIERIPLNNP